MRHSHQAPPLDHLRFPVEASLGRRYPEPPHPYRNEFQRDRDRIVHSRAFRRLENKTQVFTPGISDHFRDRLTHTMEVSQIARTAACTLGLDEDFTEALALVHDLGHPPFAHAGEEELNRQMARFSERFDHNIHALRVVEAFEQRYARFPGLNLTFEVREGMAKHSRDFEPGEFPELDEYLPGLRPPLEAQLIDLADEIAYNTADLDDGFSAGVFTLDDIVQAVPRFAEIASDIGTMFPGSDPRVRFFESLRLLIDSLVTGLIEGTRDTSLQAGLDDFRGLRRHPRRLACLTPSALVTNRQLKTFLHERLYHTRSLALARERSSHLIAGLFEFLMMHPERMPEPYASEALAKPRHRVVCGYIAGMTDGFFLRTSRQLLGSPDGSMDSL